VSQGQGGRAPGGWVMQGIPPGSVVRLAAGADQLDGPTLPPAASVGIGFTLPRAVLDLADRAICRRDPVRFALLYQRVGRTVTDLPDIHCDPAVQRARSPAKAVDRGVHHRHAFRPG